MKKDESIELVKTNLKVSEAAKKLGIVLISNGKEFKAKSPFKAEKTPSFTINDEKGLFHCFSTDKGGDALKLIQEIKGCTFPQALQMAAEWAGVTLPNKKNVKKQAIKAGEPAWFKRSLVDGGEKFEPKEIYPYVDAQGEVVLWTLRYVDENGKKQMRPSHAVVGKYKEPQIPFRLLVGDRFWEGDLTDFVSARNLDTGEVTTDLTKIRASGVRPKRPAEGWPLYAPQSLEVAKGAMPPSRVLIVEGEKTANFLSRLEAKSPDNPLQFFDVCSPLGGDIANSDITPLRRILDLSVANSLPFEIVYWQDQDDTGNRKALRTLDFLRSRGFPSLKVVLPNTAFPQGWDAADSDWKYVEDVEQYLSASTSEGLPRVSPPDVLLPKPADLGSFPVIPVGKLADGSRSAKWLLLAKDSGNLHQVTARTCGQNDLSEIAAPADWLDGGGSKLTANIASEIFAELTAACRERGDIPESAIRRRGVWRDTCGIVINTGKAVRHGERMYSFADWASARMSKNLYVADTVSYAVDFDKVSTPAEIEDIILAAHAPEWVHSASMGDWLIGWCASAVIAHALSWRSHTWILNPSGGGKTWIATNLIQPLVGNAGEIITKGSTPAGIVETLKTGKTAIVFDEPVGERTSDHNSDRMGDLLSLTRAMSAAGGATIVKGTASGGVQSIKPVGMVAFASTTRPALPRAESGRFSVLALDSKNSKYFNETVKTAVAVVTPENCRRFRALVLSRAEVLVESAEVGIAAVSAQPNTAGGELGQRVGQQIGSVFGVLFGLLMARAPKSAAEFIEWLAYRGHDSCQRLATELGLGSSEGNEASDLVSSFLATPQRTPANLPTTVRELVALGSNSNKTLVTMGCKVADDGERLIIAAASEEFRNAMSKTNWGGMDCRAILQSHPCAVVASAPVRIGAGSHRNTIALRLSDIGVVGRDDLDGWVS